jgi:hypothetical protein
LGLLPLSRASKGRPLHYCFTVIASSLATILALFTIERGTVLELKAIINVSRLSALNFTML